MTTTGSRSESPYAAEARRERRDRLRYGLAFGGALLLHASTAFGLVYWEPPEPVAPPGEMTITIDLAAAYSQADAEQAGVSQETAPQPPVPPTPPEEEVQAEEEEIVETAEPAPEPPIEEEIAEVPEAKEAEVVIAPKQKQEKKKKKPKPTPTPPSPAATSAAKAKSDVAGRGASASPSEVNAYLGRVRAALERNKKVPAGGGKGIAYVAFSITRSGGVTGLRLSRSSGVAALDSAARTTVASASLPPIPENIPAPLSLGVPINFR